MGLHTALKTFDVLIPRYGTQIVFVLVVEVDGPKCAASRARADVPDAVDEPGPAVEIFPVEGKGIGVLVKWLLKLMARFHLIHLVLAGAGRVGAGAKQNLWTC
jgi:hypothetical protein